ncbi:MAG TPA: hypothetical protein VKU00_08820 [Chthonomonadaceae bacterium]|nr:hypothetical protein [Chthonomonadaceae bacterium]
MKSSRLLLPGIILIAGLLAGCGGGGSSTQLVPNSRPVSPQVRAHVVATTRVARSMFIVAGIGKQITRSAQTGKPLRFQRILAALKHRRTVASDFNNDLGLYENFVANSDGSGLQNLFADAAHQQAAGSFTWSAPQWFNGRTDSYPAQINTVYSITRGNLTGNQGTMTATIQDPNFNNGTIHLTFKDAQGELGIADFTITNGLISAKDRITLADLLIITADDEEDDNYTDVCNFFFPDDSEISVTINPDGTDSETYTDPSGDTISTGTIQDNGDATIQYDDGSTQNVNVDTGDDSSDSGGDSSGDSSGGGDSSMKVHKPTGIQPTPRSVARPSRR